MSRSDDIRAGVRDAWDFWLSERPISTPDLIHTAIKEAVAEWLDKHGPELTLKEA